MTIIRLALLPLSLFFVLTANAQSSTKIPKKVKISKTELLNKIKGGWAGQTIGVSWSWPSEFLYDNGMIPPQYQLEYNEDVVARGFNNDDIYLDFTFVEVIERLGIDAPAESFAEAFANAGYSLWCANQMGRYNVLNGIMPPESGHWKNNPNANDIDFQIEADFIGLMSPGMVNASSEIGDKVGHIMNYGDGFYSGIYVSAMYALAFVTDDIDFIVNEALELIPKESNYYKAMKEVIELCYEYPGDWRDTWFEIQKKDWVQTSHNPEKLFTPKNIDALNNLAYTVVALLYGKSDFYKTMDIAMRSGQDTDCNVASAAGILGTVLGYDKIPDYWIKPLNNFEDIKLDHTSTSLNDAYQLSLKHSIENIIKNDGSVKGENIIIKYQKPKVLPLEVSFPNIYPKKVTAGRKNRPPYGTIADNTEVSFTFKGTGIAIPGLLEGGPRKSNLVMGPDGKSRALEGKLNLDFVAEIEITLNGKVDKIMKLPADYRTRSLYLYWNFELPKGEHTVTLKWLNPTPKGKIVIHSFVEYDDEPYVINHQ